MRASISCSAWDSFEDDAFIRDTAGGRYLDPAKMHDLNHRGEILAVEGPLNTGRPIQGYPVITQAGSSGPGQDLGARIADLIYTAHRRVAPLDQAVRPHHDHDEREQHRDGGPSGQFSVFRNSS